MPMACARCGSALGDSPSGGTTDVCQACGMPQPVRAGEDYFSALGAPRAFRQDREALEKRFYQASRALHPDRFTTQGPEAQAASLARMSFLNEAWRTLKDPDELRSYLLKLHGLESVEGSQGRSQIPAELAEGWFELQDAMMDDPASARAKLEAFEQDVARLKSSSADRMSALEQQIDAASQPKPRELLERLHSEARQKSYFTSLERDIDRIKLKL